MNDILREIQVLNQLKSDRIVRYFKTWIDKNNDLCIQMELCSNNLKNIINTKHTVFGRRENDKINEIEYFISCKIFIEIIQSVQYLHDCCPPVIHRDLKPANILFDDRGVETEIFFKLCDFGLSKILDDNTPENAENISEIVTNFNLLIFMIKKIELYFLIKKIKYFKI